MNILVVLLISLVVLIAGYMVYGRWLAKEWGIDPSRKTPAHELEDGVDYVPARAAVLMGHHFSSIAGAGPINGPIQAAAFGWVPVMLWVLIGGIFFGGVHDFGALFASVRNKGQSIGVVISETMGQKAKRLFLVFAWLTLLLVVAAFASIVASTFGATNAAGDAIAEPKALIGFAGQRVVEQTTGEKLPEGFQRAEFQLEHGFVDLIEERPRMTYTLAKLLKLHQPR